LTSKEANQKPSDLLPTAIPNPWHEYCFNNAILTFGRLVSNALQERIEIKDGDRTQYVEKYTIDQLLTPGFQLETTPQAPELPGNIMGFDVEEIG
jgi:hypothetical protein